MSYLVLARKYRPKSFSTLVGQEHVVQALRHALEQQRLHHAYLLTGTRGVGKTTIARILAKCLNCETGITAAPCGTCSACTEIDSGRFVDLLEVDAATNTKVDEMRQLLDTAQYAPTRGRYKVYVIDEVHMLSNSAFNAMLKTLEEPPEHLKFILATTDPQKIPVTVLSRCLQFNLKQMPRGAITEHLARLLTEEAVPFEPEALPHVARAAAGSMRDALSLLDQAIAHGAGKVSADSVRDMLGSVDETYLLRALDAVVANDAAALVTIADEMQSRSLSFDTALADLASVLLRMTLARTVPNALEADLPERERIVALAEALPADEIQLCYQIALQGRQDLPVAPDAHAGFTMTLLRMLAFRPQDTQSTPSISGGGQSNTKPVRSGTRASTSVEPVAKPSQSMNLSGWPEIVGALSLGGAAGQLAHNAELLSRDGDHFCLRLPAAMALLNERKHIDKLQAALSQHVGAPCRIEVVLGQVEGVSPAALAEQAREARQSDAVRAVQADPFVQDLVTLFDATVVDQSIRPLH